MVTETESHPFGISLEYIEEWDRKQAAKAVRFHNEPIRDVEKQSFWEFMNEESPEIDDFMREVADALKEVLD